DAEERVYAACASLRTGLSSSNELGENVCLHLQGDLSSFRRIAHATMHRALIEARIEGEFHIVELIAHRYLSSFGERQDFLVAAQSVAKIFQEPLHVHAHFIRCAPTVAVLVPVGVVVSGHGIRHSGSVDVYRSTTEKSVLESG